MTHQMPALYKAMDIDTTVLPYRDPKLNFDGDIDVLIDHPLYGWIAFTASPTDPMNYGKRLFWTLLSVAEPYRGGVPPNRPWPGPTPMLETDDAL